jgi:eukaryotic-like serine/threonine-protein kinase
MLGTNQQAAVRPRIVGRYALFDEIAAGGMATIHLGRLVGPVGFSRTVAIKTLHPQFAKDPEFVEMFLEEARLASRIQHPNVISTLDVATAEGEVFLVMEYVAGESLAKLVRSALKKGERMPVEIGVSVLSGMLHGLHATHEAKNEQMEAMHIVHRDVSPQNVLVGLDGVARIFDFGVAKAAAMRSQATTEGQMKGKLSYMSPEQLNSREVDRRTDVFAAGVVAWECLTGRRLFSGSDPGEVLAKVLTLDITPPIDVLPSIPRALSDAVMRALERTPEQRWQTARDFAIELERNSALAAPHAVGDWVERNASEAVQDRRRRVENVERASVELGHLAVGGPLSGVPMAAPPAAPAAFGDPNASLDTSDFANAGSGTSRNSNLTVSSSAATRQPSTSRRVGVWLGLSACGAAAAAAIWYWQQGGFGEAGSAPSAASLPEPAGETQVAPSKEPQPRSGTPSPSPEGSAPPLLEIDSLPERADAPDAGLHGEAATETGDEHGASTHRVRRAGRRGAGRNAHEDAPITPPAEKNGKSGPGARAADANGVVDPTAAEKAATPVKPGEAAAPAKAECNPPWYIDTMGIRRIKPVCL